MVGVEHRTSGHVVDDMRKRIGQGLWRPEQMLPGRRALAAEYGVALATLERAVAVLMTEGLLRADNRRGTFVASVGSFTRDGASAHSTPHSPAPLVATVAVVASITPSLSRDEAAWPLHILRACEDQLGTVPGMTMRFVSALSHDRVLRSPTAILNDLQSVSPDGIVSISNFSHLHDVLASFHSARVVNVLFDPEQTAMRQVTVDEPYGGLQAARHLLNQGYRKLLFFQPFGTAWVESRLEGVRTAAARAGATDVSLAIWPGKPASSPEHGEPQRHQELAYEAALKLMRGGFEAGVGVIAPNDYTAVGLMRAAREQGLEAGTDYGIIGFDDYERRADLSTMRPPLEQMGAEAARLMEHMLRGEAGPSRVMVHHRLIPRGSTRRMVKQRDGLVGADLI